MGNFVGLLIRHKRLEQNLSQQGLCKGICVVSYLSKIEQGLAEPSPEIVQQLLSALGVEYTTDPQLMEQGRAFIEDFFERINYGETEDPDAHAWLERQAQRLQNSPLYPHTPHPLDTGFYPDHPWHRHQQHRRGRPELCAEPGRV